MAKIVITADTIVQRTGNVFSANVDNETVLLSPRTSKYFGMAETAGRIWELLEHPATVHEVAKRLTVEYDVDFHVCLADLLDFLQLLADNDLLEHHG